MPMICKDKDHQRECLTEVKCVPKYNAMKAYGIVKVKVHVFLTTVLDGMTESVWFQ